MKHELKPSVRINIEAKKKLEDIQSKTHRSQTALLDRAVELLGHEVLVKQMLDDIADLSNDPTAITKYSALSDIFEQASGDGLRKE